MEYIIGFIMSIISGVVANYIFKEMNIYDEFSLKQEPKQQFKNSVEVKNEFEKEQIREENKRLFNAKAKSFIFYFITYIITSAGFFYPMMLHNGILSGNLNLNETKLAIDLIINRDNFLFISMIFGFIFYMPILFISRKIANIVASVLTNYHDITKTRFNIIRIPIIVFLAFFIASNMYWVLNIEVTWFEAIKFTFTILLFMIFAGLNQ